jgi:hypothetical protein
VRCSAWWRATVRTSPRHDAGRALGALARTSRVDFVASRCSAGLAPAHFRARKLLEGVRAATKTATSGGPPKARGGAKSIQLHESGRRARTGDVHLGMLAGSDVSRTGVPIEAERPFRQKLKSAKLNTLSERRRTRWGTLRPASCPSGNRRSAGSSPCAASFAVVGCRGLPAGRHTQVAAQPRVIEAESREHPRRPRQ